MRAGKLVRYQAEEVDGRWFVWDLKHPEKPPTECFAKLEAETLAAAWNVFARMDGTA